MQTALPPTTPEKFIFDFIRSLVGIQAHTILDINVTMLSGFSVVKRYRFDMLLCNEAFAGEAT